MTHTSHNPAGRAVAALGFAVLAAGVIACTFMAGQAARSQESQRWVIEAQIVQNKKVVTRFTYQSNSETFVAPSEDACEAYRNSGDQDFEDATAGLKKATVAAIGSEGRVVTKCVPDPSQ